MTGVDASADLLARFERDLAASRRVRGRVRIVRGLVEDYAERAGRSRFPAVLCHGVLCIPRILPRCCGPSRRWRRQAAWCRCWYATSDALAIRPGLLGDWAACAEAFGSDRYQNRIGVTARADRLADLTGRLAGHGLRVTAWYGVRVFTDTGPGFVR